MQYPEDIEQDMVSLYNTLSEKDKRRYAAVEAKKLGHGGIEYICGLFSCDYKTVRKGMFDLQNEAALKQKGVRKLGGGRKKLTEAMEGLDQAFLDTLKDHTAGNPMNDKVKWTALNHTDIARALKKKDLL